MRTPDMSDEELDRLFQQGAEAFPDETSLSGWLRLETQLDEAARQHQLRRQVWQRVIGLFAAEIGVVALFLLLWLNYYPSGLQHTPIASVAFTAPTSTSIPEAKTFTTTPQQARVPQQAKVTQAPSQHLRSTAPLIAVTESPEPEVALSGIRSERLLRFSRAKVPFAGAARLAAGSFRLGRPTQSGSKERATTTSLAGQPTVTPIPVGSGLADSVSAALTSPATSDALATAGQVVATADSLPLTAANAPTVAVTPSSTATDSLQAEQRVSRPAYRFWIGLAGGPELSAVLPSISPRPGGTVGLVAEYRLTSRLRVRTGVLRSVKRYGARGSDYRPPAGYWTWRIPVDEVDANCRILEIPLDFRYDVRLRPGYSLYASAGLTTLSMRNERYTYHYELNGEYTARTWSYPKGGTQALQMLRVAAGYERNLAPRWVLQAEPFVNIPLNGVGFGQMRLSSTGLLLGIRYGLGHPRVVAPAP